MNQMRTIVALMLMVTVIFVTGCNKENNDSDVRVTTYTPQDITQTSAKCGGDVIVEQGLSLSELGVCWSTERTPSANDAHFSTDVWSEPFVCMITGLEPNTKYHVRAYALRGLEYYYGEDKTFTTENGGGSGGSWNGHDYIDLGLPSGLLWATCNVGTDIPEGYGYYFAWGETQPKSVYDWSTYKWCSGNYNQLTKYCNESSYGYNGFTDNLTVLQPSDDAATANWGNGWRMPTSEEWEELYQNTTNTRKTLNGVRGRLFTAANGNSVFMPFAGRRFGDELSDAGNYGGGYYWSSSIGRYPDWAWKSLFDMGGYGWGDESRAKGLTVRPVCPTQN